METMEAHRTRSRTRTVRSRIMAGVWSVFGGQLSSVLLVKDSRLVGCSIVGPVLSGGLDGRKEGSFSNSGSHSQKLKHQ